VACTNCQMLGIEPTDDNPRGICNKCTAPRIRNLSLRFWTQEEIQASWQRCLRKLRLRETP
jgi:hypothetical protein